MATSTAEVLAALKAAQSAPIADPMLPNGLAKATFEQNASPTSGLTFYDLEQSAKFVYPVLTPLRNSIPRVSGKGGIQANWRAVTGVNTSAVRAGVSQGNRGGVIAVSTKDYTAAYKGIGLEGNVNFEAQYAGQGFDDVRAIAAKTLLESLMIQEEISILGGNASVALGTTPTPTLATAGTAGSTTYYVACVALSVDAFINGSVSGGVQGPLTRPNADGSSDTFGGGAAKVSAEASIATGNATLSATNYITATVTAVKGAAGYAWFIGSSTGVDYLAGITTVPTFNFTALATSGQKASDLGANDNSTNSLIFDGLIYQALASGSNSYYANVGSTLTSDGAGGIVEIETALKDRWDNYRLGFDTIWVNSQQAYDISKKILAGGATGAQRFVFNSVQDALNAGVMVRTYLNRYSMAGGQTIDIKIHPNMPPGMILMTSNKLPYPLSNVGNVMQVRTRQDYYQIEWPLRSRKYEYGVYADEVLQHYFPPAMGVLQGIVAG